MYIMFI